MSQDDIARLKAEVERLKKRLKKALDYKRLLMHNKTVMTASQMGKKGGKATGKKGLAAMTPEKQAEIRAKALEARRRKGPGKQ